MDHHQGSAEDADQCPTGTAKLSGALICHRFQQARFVLQRLIVLMPPRKVHDAFLINVNCIHDQHKPNETIERNRQPNHKTFQNKPLTSLFP